MTRTNGLYPDVLGEETLVTIQEQVVESTRASGKKDQASFFTRHEVRKDDLLYPIGSVPDAIYMLQAGTMRIEPVDDRPVSAMPITTSYDAAPRAGSSKPILGARYFFTRSKVTLAYRAITPCSVYKITSKSLQGLYEINTECLLQIVYWLIACSDVTDLFVPIANRSLLKDKAPKGAPEKIETTTELARAVDEFRTGRTNPNLPDTLMFFYDKFMGQRRKRAVDLGIEPSVV